MCVEGGRGVIGSSIKPTPGRPACESSSGSGRRKECSGMRDRAPNQDSWEKESCTVSLNPLPRTRPTRPDMEIMASSMSRCSFAASTSARSQPARTRVYHYISSWLGWVSGVGDTVGCWLRYRVLMISIRTGSGEASTTPRCKTRRWCCANHPLSPFSSKPSQGQSKKHTFLRACVPSSL